MNKAIRTQMQRINAVIDFIAADEPAKADEALITAAESLATAINTAVDLPDEPLPADAATVERLTAAKACVREGRFSDALAAIQRCWSPRKKVTAEDAESAEGDEEEQQEGEDLQADDVEADAGGVGGVVPGVGIDPHQLPTMRVDDLKHLAAEHGIELGSARTKAEIIAAITEALPAA